MGKKFAKSYEAPEQSGLEMPVPNLLEGSL